MRTRPVLPLVAAAMFTLSPIASALAQNSSTPGSTPSTTSAPTMGSTASPMTSGPLSTKQLNGASIYGAEDKKIGEVEDVILQSGGTGSVSVIVSVGGFLGMGERHVSVPFSQLQRNADRDRWMLPGATADSLKAMPEVNLAEVRGERATPPAANRNSMSTTGAAGTGTTAPATPAR